MKKLSLSEYLVLLRGINVGGNNIIKMSDLKTSFKALGFADVVTYIQSGNIILKSTEKEKKKVIEKIEKGLAKRFGYEVKAVVITYKELKSVVDDAPKDFGKKPADFRYDVIFLKEPLTSKEAIKKVKIKEGVDTAVAGKNVLYFSRFIAKASQSYLSKVAAIPGYKFMTIRNWNTTTKLLALMEKATKASSFL